MSVFPIAERHAPARKWLILALVLAAECMDLLDGTIVNVAAPTIARDLHATAADLQWTIGGYALAFAVGLITGARLGDSYGRKRMFVLGSVAFVAASSACALAVNPQMLIGCRLAQGVAAAMLIPQGLGILKEVFPPSELGSAFAVFGPVIGLSAVLGPIVGGVLIDADVFSAGWRTIFLVNLPLGLAAAIGAARLLPDRREVTRPRLDVVGAVIVAAAMGMLVYPLIDGREAGWPAWTYLMLAASAVLFALLVTWTRRVRRAGDDPLVEPGIFGHRGYTAGLLSSVVFFAGLAGSLLVLTLFLQFGAHYSAVHAGVTLAPFAVGSAAGAALAATVLVKRLGRTTLHVGVAVEAAGFWWIHQVIGAHGLSTTSFELVVPQLLLGLGLGMLISPLFDFVLAAVTDDQAGSASGVLNAGQQLAGALGVAVIGTIYFSAVNTSGFVIALQHCLLAELATTPVLAALLFLLPRHARDDDVAAPAEPREQALALAG